MTNPTPPLPVVQSAQINGLQEIYEGSLGQTSRVVRFYASPDCENNATHRNVIGQMEWDDCISWPRQSARCQGERAQPTPIPVDQVSFNLVEVGNTGISYSDDMRTRNLALTDGFHVFQHGDRIVIRGREHRMQQVAATWFRDVSVKDWNDEVHVKSTEHRFAQYGDVDMFGRTKLWQASPNYLESVPIEDWDSSVHVISSLGYEAAENIKYALRQLCDTVRDEGVTLSGTDFLAMIPSLSTTQVCKEF